MQVINTKQYFDEEKQIAAYLAATGKSEEDRANILDECWKNEDTHQRWLSEARSHTPVDNSNVKKVDSSNVKKAAVIDEQLQRHNMASDIKKQLITRAQIEVHDAIEHGKVDPMIAAKDAVSNAIERAVDEARAAARMEVRKS